MLDNLSVVAGNLTVPGDLGYKADAEEIVALAGETYVEVRALTNAWFFVSSSASTDIMVLKPF